MPAYSFKKQFVPLVETGAKLQTIRATARGARIGGTAHLYYAQRTKQCRKLGEGTISAVVPVEIGRHACGEPYAVISEYECNNHLCHQHLDCFAVADGFSSSEEMVQWFCGDSCKPFKGFLIQWHNFKRFRVC